MSRIFLVSNRVSLPQAGTAIHAGGLEVALRALMRRNRCVWVGWSGRAVDEAQDIEVSHTSSGNSEFVVTDLHKQEYEEYYNGFANRVLWPVLHYRQDLAEFSRRDLSGYLQVNRRFADIVASLLQPDDIVWVHDYHLIPLAKILRERGVANRIGFFLHIPMPPPEVIATMPDSRNVFESLTHYDLVGFQTETDTANFARYLAKLSGTTPHFGMTLGRRGMRLGTFPVGIETRAFQDMAATAAASPLAKALRQGAPHLAIGVDRLDYSKGLNLKLEAYERFLKTNPGLRGKVTFLQITPPSRSGIAEYTTMETELAMMSGRINSEYGDALSTPIRYVTRAYSRKSLAGFFRIARAGVVTPLRDGMNLVAKEFVAAQDPDDPGMLVLSEFAGAAAELDAALLVNPNDPEAVANAIRDALTMPVAERRARQQKLWDAVLKTDIAHWGERFISALTGENGSQQHALAAE